MRISFHPACLLGKRSLHLLTRVMLELRRCSVDVIFAKRKVLDQICLPEAVPANEILRAIVSGFGELELVC